MEKSLLDSSYNRLDEVHRAWHTALDGYHHIEDFRAGINTAIQALRNSTFNLQKQKEGLNNFDRWYATWRSKMSADEILKEFDGARTEIVHRQDLKLHSTGIARIRGWVNFQKTIFNFDPMNDSYSVASAFYEVYARQFPIAEELKHRFIFDFERRWVYDRLPNHELLEAISYAYHFFREMLSDAEREFALPKRIDFAIRNSCDSKLNNKGMLKCMILTSQERRLSFSFKDGTFLGMTYLKNIDRDLVDLSRVRERYGDKWKSEEILEVLDGIFPDTYPYNYAKLYTQIAMGNLIKDKYLVPVFFLFKKGDKTPMIISSAFKDQEEKMLAINAVTSEVIKNNIEYVLHIGEIWKYILDKNRIIPPCEGGTKDIRELIQISLISANSIKIVEIPFYKNILKKVIFFKAEVSDVNANDSSLYIFSSLVEALKTTQAQ